MTDTKKLPLIAGNWKMHNNHFEAIALVQKLAFSLSDKDYKHVEVVVLPPFTDLRSVQTLVDGDKLKIGYGAQDISRHASGAYTGEVSGPMLAKLGCSYVLCGHSERRQYHHEDDALVNAKVRAALGVSVTPILCVGEPLEVRKAGTHVEHVLEQLRGSLAKISAEAVASLVIAYEPVWAIGTGDVAPRTTRSRWPPRSASTFRPPRAPKPPPECVSFMEGPSRAITSRPSWRGRTWTAPSSAARASTPVSSQRSAGIVS